MAIRKPAEIFLRSNAAPCRRATAKRSLRSALWQPSEIDLSFDPHYPDGGSEPTRAAVDMTAGNLVLEFGADWCGYCQGAQPAIRTALASRHDLNHTKITDGPGRPLGRSFRVKLWPTLVFLQEGREIARAVRPRSADDLRNALSKFDGEADPDGVAEGGCS